MLRADGLAGGSPMKMAWPGRSATSARARPFVIVLATLALWFLGSIARSEVPEERVTSQEVLILFNASWPDEDGNGRSDSQDLAEYYAARRGVPGDHVLGLALTEREARPDRLSYPDFFRRVLVPTRNRLAELAARGTHIQYLVTCYGMPLVIDTRLEGKRNEHPLWKPTHHDAQTRTLAGWLVNIEENWEAGLDPATGKPGPRGGKAATPGSGALGTVRDDVTMPWMHGAFDRPDRGVSFKTLRAASPARRETYLVTHLGAETASR